MTTTDRATRLRGEIDRRGMRYNRVAAACGWHRSYLTHLLNGRAPLTEDHEQKILDAVRRLAEGQE